MGKKGSATETADNGPEPTSRQDTSPKRRSFSRPRLIMAVHSVRLAVGCQTEVWSPTGMIPRRYQRKKSGLSLEARSIQR